MTFRQVFLAALVILALGLVYTHPGWLAVGAGGLAMAIPVKDVAAAAQKYAARAALAGPDYQAGVQSAGARWQQNAKAGKDNFAMGVQEAVANGRYAAGIDRSGAANYEANAAGKGAQRYPQGVQAGQSKWAANVQPYLQVIANATLPPRGPKGDPRNQQRSQMIADLLRKKKVGG